MFTPSRAFLQPQTPLPVRSALPNIALAWCGSLPFMRARGANYASLVTLGSNVPTSGPKGRSLGLSTGSPGATLLTDSSVLLPAGMKDCTISIYRRCFDTTARAVTNFGYYVNATNVATAYLPYSDNTAYFEFGNSNVGDGAASAPFTKTTQPECISLVASSVSPMRQIWRNGVMIGSAYFSPFTGLPSTSAPFYLGGISGYINSDNEEVYLFVVATSAWTPMQITQWHTNPFRATYGVSKRYLWSGIGGGVVDPVLSNLVAINVGVSSATPRVDYSA